MGEYESYRISLKLKSPAGTPWQADTLTGNLVWLEALRTGDEGAKGFLAPFVGGNPPFILSDGFPEGLLPRPLLHLEAARAEDLTSYAKEKMRRKAEFVRSEDFDSMRRGKGIVAEPIASPWLEVETLHASISRATGTTGGDAGNLFSTESIAVRQGSGENGILNIYALCKEGWKNRLETMLRDLAKVGFGRDKSVGQGHFEFMQMEAWDGFSDLQGANGFIGLSTYVPASSDPTKGAWAVQVKYGKLGENAGGGNPFKRPLIQIRPGAVFYCEGKPKPFYGRIIQNLAPGFPQAVQICYCLAAPCMIHDWQS